MVAVAVVDNDADTVDDDETVEFPAAAAAAAALTLTLDGLSDKVAAVVVVWLLFVGSKRVSVDVIVALATAVLGGNDAVVVVVVVANEGFGITLTLPITDMLLVLLEGFV